MQHTASNINRRPHLEKSFTHTTADRARFSLARTDILAAVGLFIFALLINMVGITWALPSAERSQYYPAEISWYTSNKDEEVRLYTTAPYETYNPDEVYVLDALTNMSPGELDFNPRFFNYPSFMIYATGAVVKAADVAGWLTLANSKEYYLSSPGEMGQIFQMGRLLTAVISAAGVAGLYFLVRFMYERKQLALLSAIVLASMPLWVRNSHFLLVNVPAAVWMVLCAAFAAWSIHSQRVRPILISALLAGVATSTKYTSAAVLVLPAFAVLQICLDQRRYPDKRHPSFLNQARHGWLITLVGIGIAAFIGFVAVTPYALITPAEFINDVLYEGGTKLGAPPLSLVVSDFIWAQGIVLAVLSLIGCGIVLRHLRTWQSQFLLLFLLAGLGQRLISDVGFIRYTIPALPAAAICAALAIDKARQLVQTNTNKVAGWAIAVALLLPGVVYSAETLNILAGDDVRTATAGWLEQTLPENAQVGYFWQLWFDNPPMHAEQFDLVDIGDMSPESFPPVVVYPSLTTSFFDIAPPSAEKYELFKFEQRPNSLWTWPLNDSAEPLDWAYTFLDIRVFIDREASGVDVNALRAMMEQN